MKLSQLKRIEKRLDEVGYITRNQCIRNYITRLSGRILDLKQVGWEFSTKEENGDYIYRVTKKPYATIQHTTT